MKFEEFPFNVPDSKKISKQLSQVTNELVNAKDGKDALKAFNRYEKICRVFGNDATNIQVHFTFDTKNETYAKAQTTLNEVGPLIQNYSLAFEKALISSKFRPYLEEKLGSYLFKMYEESIKTFNEKIIPDLIEESKLVDKYDALIASAQINFDSKVLNLPQLGKYMENKDREVRKGATIARDKFLLSIEGEIEDIYDQLVHLRDKMAKELGYKNYIELGYKKLGRLDYDANDVAIYREEIRRVVTPLAKKINKERLIRIGISKPYSYDMSLDYVDGNPTPKGGKDYLVGEARKMYHAMSVDTDVFFNFMVDNHLMDLEARSGKQSGGYMTYFPLYKCPFIFSNFNGTSGDVDVLTHEFGHAFQAYESKNIKISEYQSPTLESCEIHSMSMEFFAYPFMDKFFDNAKRYRHSHLASAISFLPYGVTVDEFQHFVYENPDCGKEARKSKWLEIEKKYTPYKVNRGSKFLSHGSRWMLQGHIFSTPFYYIDYTLAQVLAFEFHNEDVANHEKAWKKYIKLCKLGGRYPFQQLIKKAHLKNPFKKGTLRRIIKPLVKELEDNKE